jgi:hypothetical protein
MLRKMLLIIFVISIPHSVLNAQDCDSDSAGAQCTALTIGSEG